MILEELTYMYMLKIFINTSLSESRSIEYLILGEVKNRQPKC